MNQAKSISKTYVSHWPYLRLFQTDSTDFSYLEVFCGVLSLKIATFDLCHSLYRLVFRALIQERQIPYFIEVGELDKCV